MQTNCISCSCCKMLCRTSVSIDNTPACYCLRMCIPSFFTASRCLYFLSIRSSVLWLSVGYESPLLDHTFLKTVLDFRCAIDIQCDGVYRDGWRDEIYQGVQGKVVSYKGKLRSSSSWGSPVQWMLLPWVRCLLPVKCRWTQYPLAFWWGTLSSCLTRSGFSPTQHQQRRYEND